MTDPRRLVDKLWSYCDVLRGDGVGVIEYGNAISTQKAGASYQDHHESPVADGSIVVNVGRGPAARDIVFSSPSTAGAVALRRGPTGAWTGSTLEDRSLRGGAVASTEAVGRRGGDGRCTSVLCGYHIPHASRRCALGGFSLV